MKKKYFYIVINIISLILIALFFEQYKIENSKQNSLFVGSIIESYKMELSLHKSIIGYKLSEFNSNFIQSSKNKSADKYKIVFLLLDLNDDKFDFEETIITALDYYAVLKSSSKSYLNVDLFLISRNKFIDIENYVNENYKNEINLLNDSTNYFVDIFNFPNRGAIVLLLNSNNVCLYGYYLEKANERKVFENSTAISNLLKNRYE